jgi:hypothetical protein
VKKDPESAIGGRAPLAGTMDEASSQGNVVPLRQDAVQIVPPLLLNPSCGGVAPTSERSENLARRVAIVKREKSVTKELDTIPPR